MPNRLPIFGRQRMLSCLRRRAAVKKKIISWRVSRSTGICIFICRHGNEERKKGDQAEGKRAHGIDEHLLRFPKKYLRWDAVITHLSFIYSTRFVIFDYIVFFLSFSVRRNSYFYLTICINYSLKIVCI